MPSHPKLIRFQDSTHSALVRADAIVSLQRIPADTVWPARTRVECSGGNGITVHDSDESYQANVAAWEAALGGTE